MDPNNDLNVTVERLAVATGLLEHAVARLAQSQSAFTEDAEASISRIVATVEAQRESDLEQKLVTAELKISELQARGSLWTQQNGRKTASVAHPALSTKHSNHLDSVDASAIDAALISLSLEQRIAVKAQLLRAGLLG